MEKTTCWVAPNSNIRKFYHFRFSVDKLNIHHRTIRDVWTASADNIKRRRYSYTTSANCLSDDGEASVRTQSRILYAAESYMFNFPDDLKILWYCKLYKHPEVFIAYLIIATMATPIGLLFQALIRFNLNFFAVKLKHLFKPHKGCGLT
jgi:hypothetical protein